MSLELLPLSAEHLGAAALLFAAAAAAQRRAVPALPEPDLGAVPGLLARVLAGNPGRAALEGGQLRGYLTGWCLDAFQGPERGVYCPEWAFGAAGPDRGAVLRQLYGSLARDWQDRGCTNQAITVLAEDQAAREALWWLGFGVRVIDAARDLTPIGAPPPPGLTLRRLGPEDAERLAPLAQALAEHVAAPPISVHVPAPRDAAFHRAWLSQPGRWVWLAERDGRPLGYLRAQAEVDDVAWLVRSPVSIGVSGAYVRPEERGRGLGAALLEAALAQARAEGRRACSVDFESQNAAAVAFWPRFFSPVCLTLLRRVDARTPAASA